MPSFEYIEFTNFKGIGFSLGTKNYIYDTFSNQILRVDPIIIDIIDDTFMLEKGSLIKKYNSQYSINELEKAFNNICLMKEKYNIFFNFSIPQLSISPSGQIINKVKRKLANEINQLVINVSENCNLRCSYCVYSGCYKDRRTHNKSHDMSWEIGKKAIDFFIARSNLAKERFITFYGGEPLLRLDFIKMAAIYAKSIAPDIKFSMTTNATLLDEEALKFISDYSFQLVISFDGPKTIHNKFRKFLNGKGSYDAVMEKMNLIKDQFPDLLTANLKINTVLSPHEEEIDILCNFFQPHSHPVFSILNEENRLSIGVINPDANDFVIEYDYDEFLNKFMKRMFEIYKSYHLKSIDTTNIQVAKALMNREMKLIHTRSNKRLSDFTYFWPNGICIPGMRSLFVSADGNFYPCEKLYDYDEMCIGNINDGFNLSKIVDYIEEYSKFSYDDCSKCWGFRLCSLCFIQSCQSGKLSKEKKLPYCRGQKSNIATYLKLYIDIREVNPDAFKYLEDGHDKKINGYVNSMIKD